MTAKLQVDSKLLKTGLTIAKIVKPVLQDFSLEISSAMIRIWSLDKRRSTIAHVPFSGIIDQTEEFIIPVDRTSLLDVESNLCTISLTDKGAVVKYVDEGKSRTATIKRRSPGARRPLPPSVPDFSVAPRLRSKVFSRILNQVSASAQVKQTKTDEDARINQVHFYGASRVVTSNARYFASVVRHESIDFDMSVVSSDIPFIEGFLARCDEVAVCQDASRIYVVNPLNSDFLSFTKVTGARPEYKAVSVEDPAVSIKIGLEDLKNLLTWSSQAIDGTPRCTVSWEPGALVCSYNLGELGRTAIEYDGPSGRVDLPISTLITVVGYLEGTEVDLKFGIPSMPNVLVISQTFPDGTTSSHFLAAMR